MKITRRQIRMLLEDKSYTLPHGPWKRTWAIMSRNPEFSELMIDENASIFKIAWDRAASSYDLTQERIAAEMESQLALRALEDAGLGPKATTGYRDLDLKLMGKYSEELMDKYTDEEVHPLDVNKDGQLTISEGPSTSEMPKSWQQILGDLLGKG